MGASAANRTYAVTWRDGEGPVRVGKLELGADGLRLEGGGARGRLFTTAVLYRDIAGARVARYGEERLRSRPTLVIERPGRARLRVSSVQGLGTVTELFDRLVPRIAAAV